MSKLNTALLFRSYIWLTETIYSAGYITRQEIDDKWARNTAKVLFAVGIVIWHGICSHNRG